MCTLASSCIQEIEIPIPKDFQESIVVNGKLIVGDPSIFSLHIAQFFTYSAPSRGRIHGTDAILIDSEGNQMKIKQRGTALYHHTFTADDEIIPEVGKSYMVHIGTLDGREFESTFEVKKDEQK